MTRSEIINSKLRNTIEVLEKADEGLIKISPTVKKILENQLLILQEKQLEEEIQEETSSYSPTVFI